MHYLKKRLSLLLAILLVLFLAVPVGTIYDSYFSDKSRFSNLKKDVFEDLYKNDGLSIAFSFCDKADFSQESLCSLPCFLPKEYEDNSSLRYSIRLSHINRAKLSNQDQKMYDFLSHCFQQRKRSAPYLYCDNPLRPTGGAQTQLPILLAQFPIHNQTDVATYFSLLKQTPAYFNSLLLYLEQQKEHGFTIATGDLDETIKQCDEMKGPAGKALFYDSFSELISSDSLSFSTSQKENYLQQCDAILDQYVLPAYENLADSLYKMNQALIPRKGLCQQNVSDCYLYLLQEKTGSNKSLIQIEKLLKERFSKLYPQWEYECMLLTNVNLAQMEFDLPDNPNTILNTLQDTMQDRFPLLSSSISYTVNEVPAALSSYTAPAYYFTPQIDSYTKNTIYINNPDLSTCADLFTTLAHEGYPGHMLQATYFFENSNLSNTDLALYQSLANPGYIEGWAFYTELSSFDYLSRADCITDETKTHYFNALKLQKELLICLYCMLDIRVHIYGDTAPDLVPYLQRLGLGTDKIAQNLYIYLINEPATYASYYIGYLELLETKEAYISYCDKENLPYSEKDFHNFYLSCGPLCFDQIRGLIDEHFTTD